MRFGPLKQRFGALTASVSQTLSSKGLFIQNGPPIAIDFGVAGLKVLQIALGEPPTLIAAAYLPTPEPFLTNTNNRFEFQIEALPRLIRSGGFKGNRAVCAIPAGQTFCKHMNFQKTEGLPLEAMVEVAVSQQLKCDPAALVYRHVEVNPGPAATAEVICTAVPRVFINKLLAAMKACKLELVGVQAEFVALLRGFDYITQRTEDRNLTTLYLDIGYSTTKVLIARGKEPAFARAIELGGRHLDEAVADQEAVEMAEARKRRLACDELIISKGSPNPAPRVSDPALAELGDALRRAGGDGLAASMHASALEERRSGQTAPGLTQDVLAPAPTAPAALEADLTEPLEILTDEIQLCLRYYDTLFPGQRADRAVFIGGESRHLALCQHVARVLRLPSQIADPLARVSRTGKEPSPGIDLAEPQPGWAVALGLCLSPTDL